MPKFLEKKLKERYGKDSDVPYKIMNAKGFMKGNKETAKGRAAEAKHKKDMKKGGKKKKRVAKKQLRPHESEMMLRKAMG